MGMEASDSTTSFFLSPEQQEDADSFFLSRGVGLRRDLPPQPFCLWWIS